MLQKLTPAEDQVRLWPPEQPDNHGHIRHHVQGRHKDPECQDQDHKFPVKFRHDFWDNWRGDPLVTEQRTREQAFYIDIYPF